MPIYVAYIDRKKQYEETLNEFYASITLGTVEAANQVKARILSGETFGKDISRLAVVALRHAPICQQQVLQERERKPTSSPSAQKSQSRRKAKQ